MLSNKILFVILGPSGSGKTTLLKNLLRDKDLKRKLTKTISFTTRAKRPGEKDKRDYFFISEKTFRQKLKKKKILEWTKFLNYYYGTLKDHLQDLLSGQKHIALCLDENGAARIKRIFAQNSVTIFILPPKVESLRRRMASPERKVSQKDIAQRLWLAKKQMRLSNDYDYRVVNDDFKLASKKLKSIITKEIKSRRF